MNEVDILLQLLSGAATQPGVALAGGLAIFVAGAIAGWAARGRPPTERDDCDAGDTHLFMARTADLSLIERQTRALQQQATPQPTRRVRAGKPLKPSYSSAPGDRRRA